MEENISPLCMAIAIQKMKTEIYSRILFAGSKKKTYENRELFFENTNYALEDVFRCLSHAAILHRYSSIPPTCFVQPLKENWYLLDYADEITFAIKDNLGIDLTRKYLRLGVIKKILAATKKT